MNSQSRLGWQSCRLVDIRRIVETALNSKPIEARGFEGKSWNPEIKENTRRQGWKCVKQSWRWSLDVTWKTSPLISNDEWLSSSLDIIGTQFHEGTWESRSPNIYNINVWLNLILLIDGFLDSCHDQSVKHQTVEIHCPAPEAQSCVSKRIDDNSSLECFQDLFRLTPFCIRWVLHRPHSWLGPDQWLMIKVWQFLSRRACWHFKTVGSLDEWRSRQRARPGRFSPSNEPGSWYETCFEIGEHSVNVDHLLCSIIARLRLNRQNRIHSPGRDWAGASIICSWIHTTCMNIQSWMSQESKRNRDSETRRHWPALACQSWLVVHFQAGFKFGNPRKPCMTTATSKAHQQRGEPALQVNQW